MAVDTQQIVETQFRAVDMATRTITSIAAAGGKLSSTFDKASRLLGDFGGIAGAAFGALSLGHAIHGTMEVLENTKRLKDLTGMTANTAGGLLDTFDDMGVSAETLTRTLATMGRRGVAFEQQLDKAKGTTNAMANTYKRLGIDIKKGVYENVLQLSKAATSNKLSTQDLVNLYRMAPVEASKFITVLREGPGYINEMVDAWKKLGITSDDNVERAERIHFGVLRVKSAWDDITQTIAVRLLPVAENFLDRVAEGLESWLPKAQAFGEQLSYFLHDHLDTLKQIGKVMLANYAIQRLTGTGLGGNIAKIGGGIGRMIFGEGGVKGVKLLDKKAPQLDSGDVLAAIQLIPDYMKLAAGQAKNIGVGLLAGAKAAPKTLWAGLKSAAGVAGGAAKAGGMAAFEFLGASGPGKLKAMGSGIAGLFTGGLKGVASTVTSIFNVFTKIRPALMLIGRFTIVGAVIGLIIGLVLRGYQMFMGNIEYVRSMVMDFFDRFKARIAVITDLLEPVFHAFSAEGTIGSFFTKLVPVVIQALGDAVDGIFHVLQTIILVIRAVGEDWRAALKSPVDLFSNAWKEADRLTAEKQRQAGLDEINRRLAEKTHRRETPQERAAPPHYDFRNSKFEIKQMFAEGFDPDRIAVAFTNDLAKLGERKVQSTLAPLFATR